MEPDSSFVKWDHLSPFLLGLLGLLIHIKHFYSSWPVTRRRYSSCSENLLLSHPGYFTNLKWLPPDNTSHTQDSCDLPHSVYSYRTYKSVWVHGEAASGPCAQWLSLTVSVGFPGVPWMVNWEQVRPQSLRSSFAVFSSELWLLS